MNSAALHPGIPVFPRDRVVIATRHAKAKAIRPAFRRLGLSVQTVRADTDALGTFSGEVERRGTPLECALEKCRMAHALSGEPCCLGSEGSFGPHPHLPFAASGFEILAFTDFARGYSVHEQLITFETNFASEIISSVSMLEDFATRAGFPSHALVLYAGSRSERPAKGIKSWDRLLELFQLSAKAAPVRVETDMRAHVNPTRMKVIAALAKKLARRLQRVCPACGVPGYGLVDTETGLPCDWCRRPTQLVQKEIHGCALCGHLSHALRQDGLIHADPAQCDYCNP
ncbi:MAG: DUF6671 family protein [Spirochaetota bacterium]